VVARAAPDGYTLMLGSNGMLAVNPIVFLKLPYDPINDFAPITRVGVIENMLVVNPSLPIHSVKDLIAFAKARPKELKYGSSGTGGAAFLAVESLKEMAKIEILEVPYKGAGLMTTDLVSGVISMTITGIPPLLPHVKSGKLRALAVSTTRRSAILPNLPTISEAGLPGYEYSTWLAVLAPAGTPVDVVSKLHSVIVSGIKQADATERFLAMGVTPDGGTPEELSAVIKTETSRWRKVLAAAGVKPK